MIDTLTEFFTNPINKENYKMVLIGDLSFKETEQELELFKLINDFVKSECLVLLFDHHDSSIHLNKYIWANVCVEDINRDKQCGASLMLRNLLIYDYNINNFIDYIRKWDTWEWTTKYNGCKTTLQLQTMFELYGMEDFCNTILSRIELGQYLLPEGNDLIIINRQLNKLEKYNYSKFNQLKVMEHKNLKYGIIIAEDNISLMSEYILSKNTCDVLIIYNPSYKSVSLRTKLDLELNKIAESFGGGGHKKACGFSLDLNKGIELSLLAAIISSM